jgi:hypothetical protein
MNNIFKYFSKCTFIAFLTATTFLSAEEWKKEVLNCGDQVCFVLNGEKEAMLLGSLVWAKDAVDGGKEMFYERYFYEGISLQDEAGKELHIYGPVLEETGQEWADTMPGVSFTDFVQAKQESDDEFARTIDKENVRYFSDEERDQTQVHWVNGALWQIGLDTGLKEIAQVPEGVYAFVLGSEHLYITPKIVTKKGKIQHSSFLRGGPVRSAGKLQIGPDGYIVWLSDDSGHYRPKDPEVNEALCFAESQMPEEFFMNIWVRNKPDEAWSSHSPSERNYDASEIDFDQDIPIRDWLQKYNESVNQSERI